MPMLLLRKGDIVETVIDKKGIGFNGKEEQEFVNQSIALQKGDILYLYSDGYQDQLGGGKGKKFKAAKFKKLLLDNYREPMEKQKQILLETIQKWRGSTEQMDDILVMGIQF
jgi:serine phosphatase RsbU (regulator of sigma subunit)